MGCGVRTLPESKVAAEEESGPLSQLEHHGQVLQGYGLINRTQNIIIDKQKIA
jgi:hypothetical protein